MKLYQIIALLIIGVISYSSCSSNFNPNASYKNVPVVYGLLSLSDSVQYIKIEKAFLTQTGANAYTEAQIPDSIYYSSEAVNASLEGYQNGSLINTIPLKQVDGATEGLNKDTGVFATTPNIVYQTNASLNPAYTYKLVISNTKTGQVTSAQTNLVGPFSIYVPISDNQIDFPANFYFPVRWTPAANALIYQLVIRIHYKEMPISNPSDSTLHILDWTFPADSSSADDIFGESFYRFLASGIPVNPTLERKMESVDFWLYAGANALYTYQLASIANSTNLVYGQSYPTYTNITNGIGLFSSTYQAQLNGVGFTYTTLDSIACSPTTSQLNFLDPFGNLCH